MKAFARAGSDLESPAPREDHNDGRVQSLTELIDFNALHNASHPFCVQAKSDGSLNTIAHGAFKAAVSQCADWAREAVATPGEPVALLMESDFGLVVHEFALISIQTPPLVLSPRLPLAAIEALLKTVGVKTIVASRRFSVGLKAMLDGLAAKGIKVVVGKPYDDYANADTAGDTTLRPLGKPRALDEAILLLHSSGSTGLPKPIPLTHRMLLSAAVCYEWASEEQAQGLNLTTLPMFHGFGLVAPALSMSSGKTTLFPASDGIPNAQGLVALIRRASVRSMMTVPSLLDDMCHLPGGEGIAALAPLDFVATGGAALGAGVGNRLAAAGVRLLNMYGVTETGPLSLTFVPGDDYDWRFFRLRKDMDCRVAELAPRGGERRFRLTVFAPGKTEGFEIADQLVRNEKQPATDFAAVGRDDDILVLATGEKADPLVLEAMLSEAACVRAAVAFGDHRFHLGVLVEPPPEFVPADGDGDAFEALRAHVWDVVQAAGERMDSSARVPSPDAIVFVPAGMHIPRTDKGSIARREAYALFAREIDQAYEKLLEAATEAVEPLDLDHLEASLASLFRQHVVVTTTPASGLDVKASLFDMGIDSLRIQQLRRLLIAAVAKTPALSGIDAAELITPQFVYVKPTIREMAAAIAQRSVPTGTSAADTLEEMRACLAEFAPARLSDAPPPTPAPLAPPPPRGGAVVLLTGSSGSLGAHLAAELARRDGVARVLCVVRKERGTNAQPTPGGGPFDHRLLTARGLALGDDAIWSKLATVEVDPAAPQLGLGPLAYAGLRARVTHVVHAAWPMNYLLPLRAFRPQFAFLRSLLELVAGSGGGEGRSYPPRLVFISSIAAAARLGLDGAAGRPIPEAPVPLEDAACGVGYADGKLVCEAIVQEAAKTFAGQLEVTSIRCGQMTGARHSGVWNEREQIPMLVKTGQNLGHLPRLSGTLSWIPVDDAAYVVADVTLGASNLPLVLHLENPVRQPWDDVMGWLAKTLGLPEPSLPFDAWMAEVARQESNGDKFPAQQLQQFFQNYFEPVACGQVVLETQVAARFSPRLRSLGPVDESIVVKYITHWKKTRYLGA